RYSYQVVTVLFFLYFPLTLTFFFNDPPTTEIYTLSLHDALPILRVNHKAGSSEWSRASRSSRCSACWCSPVAASRIAMASTASRSEEHTSELQSRFDLVCRLLLEKKKKK